MSLLDTLNQRYACKRYDRTKLLSKEDLDFIMEAVRLSPSSFGLQPYKVLVVDNPELKAQLRPLSWNQSIVEDASHLFIFCNYTELTDERIQKYAQLRSRTHGKPVEEVMSYIQYMTNAVGTYSPEQFNAWASKQTYIALGHLLIACGERKIDATPIEGFDKAAYDKILNLNDKGLTSSVLAVAGYRTADEYNQFNKKIRKSTEDLFEKID